MRAAVQHAQVEGEHGDYEYEETYPYPIHLAQDACPLGRNDLGWVVLLYLTIDYHFTASLINIYIFS
jgi:hypothetical protein